MSAPLAQRLVITGTVQGVWYRASAAEAAARFGVRGWVRNTADGAVEALVIGTEYMLESFVAWCHQGPPKAKVARVTVTEVDLPDPLPTDFTVAPDA
ncbi:acylphosphatase [Denitromonas ohlonensis]|uniref:acylphosphatase n=2 Tax=Denitromonas TaxID=139331 RepID=A0A557RC78_9RHOO|nr:acylphosphatase [Denitromonas ohlonensis]TVO62755.1 acylphosphatase [Denitromonas ohlonensis]TVO78960.1 acylphosphatase [Denitromonas ohlonensis]